MAVVRNVSQLLGQAEEITDGRGQEVLYSAPMITTLLPHIIQIQQLGLRPPVPGGIQNLLQSHQQQKQQQQQQQHQQKQVATPVSSGQFADSPQMHQQRAMQQQQLQQQQQQQRIMLQQQQLQLQLQQQRAMLQQQQQPQSQQQQKQQQQQQQQGVMLPEHLLLLHPLPATLLCHQTISPPARACSCLGKAESA